MTEGKYPQNPRNHAQKELIGLTPSRWEFLDTHKGQSKFWELLRNEMQEDLPTNITDTDELPAIIETLFRKGKRYTLFQSAWGGTRVNHPNGTSISITPKYTSYAPPKILVSRTTQIFRRI